MTDRVVPVLPHPKHADEALGVVFCDVYGGFTWAHLPQSERQRLGDALTAVRQYLEVRDERGQVARECADAAVAAAQAAHAVDPDLDDYIGRLEVAVERWLGLNPHLMRKP